LIALSRCFVLTKLCCFFQRTQEVTGGEFPFLADVCRTNSSMCLPFALKRWEKFWMELPNSSKIESIIHQRIVSSP
jgi:hypothetical protein